MLQNTSINTAQGSAQSAIQSAGAAVGYVSNNVANSQTLGYKQHLYSFSNAGYSVALQNTMDIETTGNFESGTSLTDLAIAGAGFYVVQDEGGNYLYMRTGQFRADVHNELSVDGKSGSYKLLGWQYDDKGDLPATRTLLTSLATIVTTNVVSQAIATTTLTIPSINLDSSVNPSGGISNLFSINPIASPSNGNVDINGIIVPDAVFNPAQSAGIRVRVESAQSNLSNSKENIANYFYGGVVASTGFVGTGTALTGVGGTFQITVGGSSPVTITAGTGNDSQILISIVNAVNNSGVAATARIYVDSGSQYHVAIAPNDPQSSLSFSTGGLSTALGIATQSIAASTQGTMRFSTMQQLATLISSNSNLGVNASAQGSKGSLLVTSSENQAVVFENTGSIDLLSVFGVAAGYGTLSYDPLSTTFNIASGKNRADSGASAAIYDSLGSSHNIAMSFKKIGSNQWVAETYVTRPSELDTKAAGYRTDGLLQATALTFDVNGNLVSDSVAPAGGSSYSPAFLGQDTDVKNTNGNTLIIGTGASSVTLTYNNGISSTTPLATAGTTITATTGSVQLGSISYPISWTVGSSDGVTLKNIGDAINGLGIGLVANLSVAGSNTILNITSPTVSSAAGSFGMTITGIALTTTFVGASGQFRSISDVADALNAIPANTRPATPSVLVSNNNYQLRLIAAGGGPVTIGGNSGIAFTSTQPVGSIATAMTIPWNPNTIGAGNSVISFSYNPSNFYQAEQKYSGQISANGRSPGKLTGFSINGTGDIIGNFDNGDSRALARIALATFINPNGLTAGDDSTFSPNAASGPQTLVDSGSPGAGTITPSYLEDSNVDIVTELTKLVNLQRFYTANGKVLQAANNMTLEFVKSVIVT